ncbi:MAG: hypothetical protein ACI4WS_02190 [Oscillospiraceae bacterium]
MKSTRYIAAALSALLLAGCAASPDSGSSNESTTSAADTTQPIFTAEPEITEPSPGEEYTPGDRDVDGVYVVDGYAAKLDYPLNEKSITYAAMRFEYVYEQYIRDSGGKVYVSVIPDKGYFLAEQNGYPALDYAALTEQLTSEMDFAEYIDIFPLLELADYYHTDTHWRQECITDVAAHIAGEMGVTLSAEYDQTEFDKPFYGVHCRQTDITLEPDALIYLESGFMSDCTVYDAESDAYTEIYNLPLAEEDDPYDIFLSGAKSLMTIENPAATTEKELIIFRDSFTSSLAPLLAEGYAKITLVDIRYLSPMLLGRFVDFHGQDVLFLYSTLVLNNSVTIK